MKNKIFGILGKVFLSKEARELGEELNRQNAKVDININDRGGWSLSRDPESIVNSPEFKKLKELSREMVQNQRK